MSTNGLEISAKVTIRGETVFCCVEISKRPACVFFGRNNDKFVVKLVKNKVLTKIL